MELIWQDLANNAADLPSPNWHDAVVHKRLDHPMPGEALSLQDAFREIQGWRNAGLSEVIRRAVTGECRASCRARFRPDSVSCKCFLEN